MATLASNAWIKRGDRKHERALDFERRVWETKNAVLTQLITKCNTLRAACEVEINVVSSDEADSLRRKRIFLLEAFERVHFDADASVELILYADKSVMRPAERLSKLITGELESLRFMLREIREFRVQKELSIDGQEYEAAAQARNSERYVEREICKYSTFDTDEVAALCTSIIDAARADLRGGPD